ncbi:MAG: radical SAM protein [Alphaproteobacteria bacterium]|nr:radical SAM protein [Alphaproteobacteria bacterium]
MNENDPLIDPFGRAITYLRVSVTDRCDMRCVYCMAEHMTFLPRQELLTIEELDELCQHFVALGVRKIRLTGGEPLVRRGIFDLIERLGKTIGSGLDELTLTTNGNALVRDAARLASHGIKRVNVSMDTIDDARFASITRWGKLPRVMEGIEAAQKAGLRVKVNAVLLKGLSEPQAMIDWCYAHGTDLVFIEAMPMGEIESGQREAQHWSVSDLATSLEAEGYDLRPLAVTTGGPARYFQCTAPHWQVPSGQDEATPVWSMSGAHRRTSHADDAGLRLGFITPLSHNFCAGCNRVRLTCTGKLFLCLGQDDNADLCRLIRAAPDVGPADATGATGATGANGSAVVDARATWIRQGLHRAVAKKPWGHEFAITPQGRNVSVERHMSLTGG